MLLNRDAMFAPIDLPTVVVVVETVQGVFDVLSQRTRLVLARNLDYFGALAVCKAKGWKVAK